MRKKLTSNMAWLMSISETVNLLSVSQRIGRILEYIYHHLKTVALQKIDVDRFHPPMSTLWPHFVNVYFQQNNSPNHKSSSTGSLNSYDLNNHKIS